jgi:hypothetical protein
LAQLDLERVRAEFQAKIKVMMTLMRQMPRELLLVFRYSSSFLTLSPPPTIGLVVLISGRSVNIHTTATKTICGR